VNGFLPGRNGKSSKTLSQRAIGSSVKICELYKKRSVHMFGYGTETEPVLYKRPEYTLSRKFVHGPEMDTTLYQ